MARAGVCAALMVMSVVAVEGRAGGVDARAAQPAPTYANPVLNGLAVNPFVLTSGSTHHAYMSGFDFGGPIAVPAFSSTDLATWNPAGVAMSAAASGAWTDKSSGSKFTSPSVRFYSGNPASQRYVLYFTGTQASTGSKCIGVATASSASGPFVGQSTPLICGAQDPSPVPSPDGYPFPQLLYKKNGASPGIYNQILAPDGLSLLSGSPASLIYAARSGWWQNGVVERPTLVSLPGEAVPILLFAAGTPNTGGRGIGWAPCSQFAGVVTACSDQTSFSASGRPDRVAGTFAPFMATSDDVAGPSGPQVVTDGTDLWMVYDALPGGSCSASSCSGTRTMRLDKLCVDDGRPRTNGPTTGAQPLARGTVACDVDDVPGDWVATWGGSVSHTQPSDTYPNGFSVSTPQTLRQMVHTSIAGDAVRIRLTNEAPSGQLSVGAASVAVSSQPAGSGSSVTGTPVPLTFAGSASVQVPAGATVLSDAVDLDVPGDHDLAVSLYFPTPTGRPSVHLFNGETSHVGNGNLTGSTGGGFGGATTVSSYYLSAVDVHSADTDGGVVVLGDSLSDGLFFLQTDSETRWPDKLVDRLAAPGNLRVGVANVAFAGRTLFPESDVDSGLGGLDPDVLTQTGARTLVVLLGWNDIDGLNRTNSQVVADLGRVVDRARAAGLRVVGVTLPPFGSPAADPGATPPCPNGLPDADPTDDQRRAAVNDAIRPGGSLGFDLVGEVDGELRDAADFSRLRCPFAGFVSGDPTPQSHPGPAGHAAMAAVIDPVAPDTANRWSIYANDNSSLTDWTSGDGATTVALPDGRTLWLMNDTFLDVVNADNSRPGGAVFANNTAVVEQPDGTLGPTLVGGPPPPGSNRRHPWLESPVPDADIWVLDGVVEGNLLRVLVMANSQPVSRFVVTLSLPDLVVQGSPVPFPLSGQAYGLSSFLETPTYTYGYGMATIGGVHQTFVARVATGHVAEVASWQYFTQAGWTTNPTTSTLVGLAATEFGVVVDSGDDFVLLGMTEPLGGDIVTFRSSSPSGPFTGPTFAYRIPEWAQPCGLGGLLGMYALTPHEGHGRWPTSSVFSYSVNCFGAFGLSGPLSNVNNYRPRYIELDLSPGGSGGEAPLSSPPPLGEAPDAGAGPAIGAWVPEGG